MKVNNYLGFNENFRKPIRNGDKKETIRLKKFSTPNLNVGDYVFAVVSHKQGPFAILKIQERKILTVKEIINSTFETHKNYKNLGEFNSRMEEYYNPPFSYEDEFVYYKFNIVETDDEKIAKLSD